MNKLETSEINDPMSNIQKIPFSRLLSVTTLFFATLLFLPQTSVASVVGKTITQPAGSSLSTGLVGHWTFDGKDLIQNVADRSGNGNHGKMTGFTSTSSATVLGKLGQGLQFDGSDDYVNGGDIATIDDATSLSGCAWVKPDALTADNTIISKISGVSDGFWFWRDDVGSVSGRTDIFAIYVAESTGTGAARIESVVNASKLNIWTHVCFTYVDNTAINGLHLYINGVEDANSPVSTADLIGINAGTNIFNIGALSSGASTFSGSVDDVRVYSRVLSPSEIELLYNQSATKFASTPTKPTGTGLSAGLVGHWTFDGKDLIQNVADRSGNGNHGMMSGFTSTSSATVLGKLGQALNFAGTDDQVLANQSSITSYPFTLAIWAKPSSLAGQYAALSYASDASNVIYYTIGTNGDKTYLFVRSSISEEDYAYGSRVLNVGEWVSIVGVFNSATDKRIYVNGQQDSLLSTSISFAQGNKIGIGFTPRSSPYGWFNGTLDDARIYNRTLSATEIEQLYNQSATKFASTPTKPTGTGLSAGLVGHWTFDGKDLIQNVADRSGNANHGKMSGFTSTSSATVLGKLGQGLQFDGSNDHIQSVSGFNKTNIGGTPTISFWIRPAGAQATVGIMQIASALTSGNPWVLLQRTNSTTVRWFLDANYRITQTVNDNIWYHIALTYNGTTWQAYKNGVADGSYVGGIGANNGTYTWFGNGYNGYFKGSLDDVRIYSRTLSATEIKQLYNMGR
jgi:hypothetical protein